jgi:hypothetical protein
MKLKVAALAIVLAGGSTLPPRGSQPAPEREPLPVAPPEEPLAAAEEPRAATPDQAAGTELFYSSDSDGTQVVRAALNFDLRHKSENDHLGISVEKAWYDPAKAPGQSRERVFLRAAGTEAGWQGRARIGTDGDNVIGSVSVNDTSRFRKEVFVERDIVETRQGLEKGLYSTFAGAAIDLPADDRNIFTALAGIQEFTGDNLRLHLRGSYIHVAKPEWGLSAQLRGRYLSNSDPREFDYYSPRWFAEILPVAQLRRFVSGWQLVGAAGLGIQRDSESDWRPSRYAHARFRSPERKRWSVTGAVTYTNTPSLSGSAASGYSYVQMSVGVLLGF